MDQSNKGFVVSAVLYPLLVLFLALIMGLLSMTDTRKRILDKMKLEISDSIFDEATCSCDTILNKLNYLIKNGVGGGNNGGSYTFNVLGLNVKKYETPSDLPHVENAIGDVAIITTSIIENEDYQKFSYYVSTTPPPNPKEGQVWVVQDINSEYKVNSDYSSIGINYAMEYYNGKWTFRKTYVYTEKGWTLLYYVSLKDTIVDITDTDINAEIKKTYEYTGQYQTFNVKFSGYYRIELWGAAGAYNGGKGGYTKGEIYLNASDKLYIYVGGAGKQGAVAAGGWNGGGKSGNQQSTAGSGGGATDVRLLKTETATTWNEFESLKSRIMVAAGGGGGAYYSEGYSGVGGVGGGLTGGTGTSTHNAARGGAGGLQTGPGTSLLSYASFGVGGGYQGGNQISGGGGGGYYGGNYGGDWGAGGGGGSSYISGHTGCDSIKETSTSTNREHTGNKYHYSGYYFINTSTTSGSRSGNGYATITLLTVEYKTKEELESLKT